MADADFQGALAPARSVGTLLPYFSLSLVGKRAEGVEPARHFLGLRLASSAVVCLTITGVRINCCTREGGLNLTWAALAFAGPCWEQVGFAVLSIGLGDAEKGNLSFCFCSVS